MRNLKSPLVPLALLFGVLFLAALAFLKNYHSLPKIEIVNDSSHELRNVIVSGYGFKEVFPVLKPKEKGNFEAAVTGESGITVSFAADGKQIQADNLAYIETQGGYWAKITIDESLDVDCVSGF